LLGEGGLVMTDAAEVAAQQAAAAFGAGTAGYEPAAAAPRHPPAAAVQLALQAGWTIAVLYGTIGDPPADSAMQLPTVHELMPGDRRELELARLGHLLTRLSMLPECMGIGLPREMPALDMSAAAHAEALRELNLAILRSVASAHPEIELAYELGRSLRDTVNPPTAADGPEAIAAALKAKLARGRVAKLQEWLATLTPAFPQHATAAVAASIGRWGDFTAQALGTRPATDTAETVATMRRYLMEQGDVWLMLLIGARSAKGLLTPEGYAVAGEAALRRSAKIVWGIVKHYWPVWVVLGIALAGLLYLSIAYLGGAAKVWTAIATVAGSLGVSAQTIASAASRLAAEAERPVFAMAEEDVMAWAVTTIPVIGLPAGDIRRLRKAGVEPPSTLGRP
jgi:stage V sporulation protein SpoVS